MNIFNSISDFHCPTKTVVTLGTFDGVHLGHQKIIRQLVQESQTSGHKSLVLSFLHHPRTVLVETNKVSILSTNPEKTNLLENLGLDYLVIHPFDREFSELSPSEFVQNVLVNSFNVSKIIIGHDHRFGKNRAADIDDLIAFGAKYGFEVEQISAEEIDDVAVSSTKIRHALKDGNVALANSFLGYPYGFTGTVVQGRQLGRTLGFATANLSIDNPLKVVPKSGVYAVTSQLQNRTIFGVMNIGIRPTVNGTHQTIEVHFLDFNADLYDQNIEIQLIERLRDEQKFDSLDALKNQITADCVAARLIFGQ